MHHSDNCIAISKAIQIIQTIMIIYFKMLVYFPELLAYFATVAYNLACNKITISFKILSSRGLLRKHCFYYCILILITFKLFQYILYFVLMWVFSNWIKLFSFEFLIKNVPLLDIYLLCICPKDTFVTTWNLCQSCFKIIKMKLSGSQFLCSQSLFGIYINVYNLNCWYRGDRG